MNPSIPYAPRAITIIIIALVPALTFAQSKAGIRQPLRAASPLLYYESSPTQVIETFALIQQANGGNPAAMHELGYRYLLGRGLPPDTGRAAEWILKAAGRGMPLAQFNAGILYTHAIGVPWDPFKAFHWFKLAAEQEHAAAQFILGLLYTDGLAVPRDLGRAFTLVRRAADQGDEQAREVLAEFRRRGIDSLATPERPAAGADSARGLVLLHFETATNADVSDSTLVRELAREVGRDEPAPAKGTPAPAAVDSERIRSLEQEADRGLPEAFTVLGRMFERGTGAPRDLISAAKFYLRANRLESPRAPVLLSRLVQTDEFARVLTERSLSGDRDARYVWAGLSAIDFEHRIGGAQALKLLQENIQGTSPHPASLLELGLWHATGHEVRQDVGQALALWRRAESLGVVEAGVRCALATVLLGGDGRDSAATLLRAEASRGSVLGQLGAGYCFERGVNGPVDLPDASAMYRTAAQRGSFTAYLALKRMYDRLRPTDPEFQIDP